MLVVDRSVDALERLRKATTGSNVFYLVGSMDVLPLTDEAADEMLASPCRTRRCRGRVLSRPPARAGEVVSQRSTRTPPGRR